MRFVLLLSLLLAAFSLTSCSESFTDPRDGQVYKVVQIGNVTWFAQNLNYEIDGSVCPEGDSRNCDKYGRLYTWEVAQNVCPEGWLLPDSLDFAKLVDQAGGESQAGDALKSTDGWFKKGNGSDGFGLKALPAGFRNVEGTYDGIGGYAYIWSATETLDGLAYYLFLDFSSKSAGLNAFGKGDFRSVRCIKKP